MRRNLAISIFAVLLLLQNQICLGSRIDFNPEADDVDVSEEADLVDEPSSRELPLDIDDESTEVEGPEENVPERGETRKRREANVKDSPVDYELLAGSKDSPQDKNLEGGETLDASESRTGRLSATGVSVGNGYAVGYGRATIGGGNPAANGEWGLNGRRGNPGGETVEEFAFKSGKDIAIARVGDRGRPGQEAGRNPNYENGFAGGERGPHNNGNGAVGPGMGGFDKRVNNNRRFANGRTPGPGAARNHGIGNDRPIGGDGRFIDDVYLVGDKNTRVRIPPNVRNDGSFEYRHNTDGRPTTLVFTDRNGGMGVINHFHENRNLDNGLNGNKRVTGTAMRGGYSMTYGGGNFEDGNMGSGAVAFGRGNRGSGAAMAYAGRSGGGVAMASGSAVASGSGIVLGDTFVGDPNGGSHGQGFYLGQGTVIANGKSSARGRRF